MSSSSSKFSGSPCAMINLLFQGDLSDESEMLEWLIQQRSGADDKV